MVRRRRRREKDKLRKCTSDDIHYLSSLYCFKVAECDGLTPQRGHQLAIIDDRVTVTLLQGPALGAPWVREAGADNSVLLHPPTLAQMPLGGGKGKILAYITTVCRMPLSKTKESEKSGGGGGLWGGEPRRERKKIEKTEYA